jgi:predicted HAD superfamily phosphohydrolase YqeG
LSFGAVGVAYRQFANASDLPRLIAELSARTVVFDIEPFVAAWDGTQDALDEGIARVLDNVGAIPGVRAVCFATNSARQPSALPDIPGIDVSYLVSARKPVRTAAYRRLPLPGVVIGDQVMTDGLLARRLGYSFLHYRHPQPGPLGPRLLDAVGELARPLMFRH